MLKYEIISHVDDLPVFFNYYEETIHLVPSHWHHHLEIIYITTGSMEITTNDTTYTLYENDMFVVNGGTIHMTKINHFTRVLLLQLPYDVIKNSVKDMDKRQFKAYYPHKDLENDHAYKQIANCLNQLITIFQNKESGYAFLFNSVLNQVLYHLYTQYSIYRTTTPLRTDKNRTHIQKAFDYMADHYSQHISLKDISEHLALNPEYFCRLFKRHVGFTFLEYLNQIRIMYIYNDLISTTDSVTDIRERHGFKNYKVFNRLFKETYGCSPSQIRK